MVELILRLPSLRMLDTVLPFLKKLKIPYQTRTIEPLTADASKKATVIAAIQSGAMNIPDFDRMMSDFEESRQDRPLYGRA
jgi:hypothetical protein